MCGRWESPPSATKRALGRSDASSRPRLMGTVQSPRRWRTRGHRHTREERPRTRRQLELEERRRDLGVGRVALVAAQRSDLVPARARHDEAREHLGGQRPVDAHEVDERPPRRLRQIVARDEASEEDDLLHPLRAAAARLAVTTEAHEQANTVAGTTARVDGPEHGRLLLDGRRAVECRSERPAPSRS